MWNGVNGNLNLPNDLYLARRLSRRLAFTGRFEMVVERGLPRMFIGGDIVKEKSTLGNTKTPTGVPGVTGLLTENDYRSHQAGTHEINP